MQSIIEALNKDISEAYDALDKLVLYLDTAQGVISAVQIYEFTHHLAIIKGFIDQYPDDIPGNFKAFCASRVNSSDDCISIADNPNTPLNQVLCLFAKKIFSISTLSELLNILVPNITHCVQLSLPALPEGPASLFERKKMHDALAPIIDIQPISALATYPITDDALKTCVFSDNLVLVLDHSTFASPLTFQWHIKCYEALHALSPNLANKVYAHHFDFRLLLTDIKNHQSGVTPYSMIKNFIWGLELGGKNYQGQASDASSHALMVVSRFFEAFNQLPEDLRTALNALKNLQQHSLAYILDQLTNAARYNYSCVEANATALTSYLSANQSNSLLHKNITPQTATASLRAAYQTKVFELKRDTSQPTTLPFLLVEEVAKIIQFPQLDAFVYFLLHCPIVAYEGLLLNVHFDLMRKLAPAVKSGIFSTDRIVALFKVYAKKATLVGKDYWTLEEATSKALFHHLPRPAFYETFTTFADILLYSYLYRAGNPHRPSRLELLLSIFDHLNLAFKKYILFSCLDILDFETTLYEKQETGIQLLRKHAHLFNDTERHAIFKTLHKNLHITIRGSNFADLMHTLDMLSLFNISIETLSMVDDNQQNIIHHIVLAHTEHIHEHLDLITKALPENILHALFNRRDKNGNQPIHYAVSAFEFLTLMQYIPHHQRLSLCVDENNVLRKQLSTLTHKPTDLINATILFYINLMIYLPLDNQVQFLCALDHENGDMLGYIASIPVKTYHWLQCKLPTSLRQLLPIIHDKNYNTPLLMQTILTELASRKPWGETIAEITKRLPGLLKPELQRLLTNTLNNANTDNLQHLVALFKRLREHYQNIITNFDCKDSVTPQLLCFDAKCKILLVNDNENFTNIALLSQCRTLLETLGESDELFSLTLQSTEQLDYELRHDPLRKEALSIARTVFAPKTKGDLLHLFLPSAKQFATITLKNGTPTLETTPFPADFQCEITDADHENTDWLRPYLLFEGTLIDVRLAPILPEHFENAPFLLNNDSLLLRLYDYQYHPTWKRYPDSFINLLNFKYCNDKHSTFQLLETLHPDNISPHTATFFFEDAGSHHHYIVYKKSLAMYHPRQFMMLCELYQMSHQHPHRHFNQFVTLYEKQLNPAMRKKYLALKNKTPTDKPFTLFNSPHATATGVAHPTNHQTRNKA